MFKCTDEIVLAYIKDKNIRAIYSGNVKVFPRRKKIKDDIIASCYANGYWINGYPWTVNTPWMINI